MIPAVEIVLLLALIGVAVAQLFVVRQLAESLILRHRVNDQHTKAIRTEAERARREATKAIEAAHVMHEDTQLLQQRLNETLSSPEFKKLRRH